MKVFSVEKQNDIDAELEKVREKHGGVLYAAHVVDFAENKKTALHNCFEWDDGKAAIQHRLNQARAIIRVTVIVPERRPIAVRAYVSLGSDRRQTLGGYRSMENVMADQAMRSELLNQARNELSRWRQKYRGLTELSAIYAVIDEEGYGDDTA